MTRFSIDKRQGDRIIALEFQSSINPMNVNDIAYFLDHDPGTAYLKDDIDLTPEIAEVLIQHDGPIKVSDVFTIPEDFAEIIVKHNGKGLAFNNSNGDGPRLSNRVAQILATYKGDLTLNDIERLNHGYPTEAPYRDDIGDELEIAKAFAQHKGSLCLGITEISIEAARELFKHEGPLWVDGLYDDDNWPTGELLALLEDLEKRRGS